MISLVLCILFMATSVHCGTLLRGSEEPQGMIEVWAGDKKVYEAKANINKDAGLHKGHSVSGIGTIVQIGQKVWQLVKNNKAVVNYEQDWTGAVPKEYEEDWTQLAGWKDMKSEQFRFHYKVGSDTVSELKWKYAWSSQGHDADGKGHYVMNAGARIDKLYARVGQELQASVTSLAPINYGTIEDPIGGIDIQVSFTSASAFNSATTTCTVTVRGDERYEVKDCQGNDP